MSQAGLNRIWAQALLEQLHHAGAKHVCIAPGSRSSPLSIEALELADELGFQIHTHFDERALAFLALGLAKASQQPVIIIVTSGTAVANLLPAVAESGLTREKLVLLTADRPVELVGVGANQAINQKGIFSSHVLSNIELISPSSDDIASTYLVESLAQIDLVMQSQSLQGGAIHINCPYPEPLYIQDPREKEPYQSLLDRTRLRMKTCHDEPTHLFEHIAELTNGQQQALINQINANDDMTLEIKGVVIIGSMTRSEAQQVKQFADDLGWPVLCDPQSGINSDWAHFDIWLQNPRYFDLLSQADCILQFGARLVSKRLGQWIKTAVNQNNSSYWLFSPETGVLNPDRLAQLRTVATIPASVELLCQHIHFPITLNDTKEWTTGLKSAKIAVREATKLYQLSTPSLTECELAINLSKLIKQTKLVNNLDALDLFIGNSLIVRLVDMFTALPNIEVFTNRGASGIDGLMATAVGVQKQQQRPMISLIGDTSLLYDLNSLALLSEIDQPHIIIVTNNDGGAIFDLLPVPSAQKQTLYQMPHGYQFNHTAKQFGLHYNQAHTFDECQQSINHYLDSFSLNSGTQRKTNSALLVEIITPTGQASSHIQSIIQAVKSHAL